MKTNDYAALVAWEKNNTMKEGGTLMFLNLYGESVKTNHTTYY